MTRRRKLLRWGVSMLASAPFTALAFLVLGKALELWPGAGGERYQLATITLFLVGGLLLLSNGAYDLVHSALTPREDR